MDVREMIQHLLEHNLDDEISFEVKSNESNVYEDETQEIIIGSDFNGVSIDFWIEDDHLIIAESELNELRNDIDSKDQEIDDLKDQIETLQNERDELERMLNR